MFLVVPNGRLKLGLIFYCVLARTLVLETLQTMRSHKSIFALECSLLLRVLAFFCDFLMNISRNKELLK